MKHKIFSRGKYHIQCKLCWQLSLSLLLIMLLVEILFLFPFFQAYKIKQLNLFNQHSIKYAKFLVDISHEEKFTQIATHIMKRSAIKGGIIYNLSGKPLKRFGEIPKVTPVFFKRLHAIDHHFYQRNKNSFYALWDSHELQKPYEIIAILDTSSLHSTLIGFIKEYWDEALLLLLIQLIASFFISYLLLIRPIRAAYNSLQNAKLTSGALTTKINVFAKNELGFIFTTINEVFDNLTKTTRQLLDKTQSLDTLNKTLDEKVQQRTASLNEANRKLSAMALFPEENSNPVFRVDTNGRILYANPASEALFKYWDCYQSQVLPKTWLNTLTGVLKENSGKQIEAKITDSVFLLDLIPVISENYVNIYGTDITKRKEIEKENRFLHTYNPITKLYNKSFLRLLMEEKNKQASFAAVLFLQINDLMAINQNLGHSIGDKFLSIIAVLLKKNLPENNLIGHFSHNIFALILYSYESLEAINDFACELITLFSKPFTIEKHELRTSINIGIALFPEDSKKTTTLFQQADMALLQANNLGANNLQFYTTTINQKFAKHHQLYQDLHDAVMHHQLLLLFQPQLSLATNKIVGAETLIRWQHPLEGLIAPDEFIEILENSSLIYMITPWLFEVAAKQHVAWREQGLGELRLAVNLTAKQFTQENLLEILQTTLTKFKVNPKYLEIEITERASLTNPKQTIKVMHAIHSLGFDIAIDDFGSDYSSLKYLQKLPVNKIKIDKSFIDSLSENHEGRAIVKAIIGLAKELKLTTLAEGVETIQQKNFLKKCGCDEIQGYLLSKPVNEEDFRALIR